MWKWIKWGLLVIVIMVIAFLGYNAWLSWRFEKSKTSKFITASPVDLTQINRISTFRSCMGHDYSAKNILGEAEENRSMKHYVEPQEQYRDSRDKVKLFAPFDGEIARIENAKEKFASQDPRFGGRGIALSPKASPTWTFEFGHVYLLDNLQVGSKIQAGQLIGYAYVMPTGGAFDLALWDDIEGRHDFSDQKAQTIDSVFNHMTDGVLAEFSKYGLTKDDLILTKEYRDARPCQNAAAKVNVMGQTEVNFVQSGGENRDMVEVKQQ